MKHFSFTGYHCPFLSLFLLEMFQESGRLKILPAAAFVIPKWSLTTYQLGDGGRAQNWQEMREGGAPSAHVQWDAMEFVKQKVRISRNLTKCFLNNTAWAAGLNLPQKSRRRIAHHLS